MFMANLIVSEKPAGPTCIEMQVSSSGQAKGSKAGQEVSGIKQFEGRI
jgi:hypothetical protein